MHAYLQPFLDFAAQHVWLAVWLAFLISAGEALLVIGLIVPSTIVLVGLGGLIGVGKLPFWPIYFATVAGAVLGDALSYWIGHHYRERLYNIWPFSRYQSLLGQGQAYFAQHGGKSVVIGRFIPGVKSVVPGIAGMMGMNPIRFSVLNVASAFAWGATHLLPAMSAGWLVGALATISKRLAITVALILLLTILLIWLAHRGTYLALYYLPFWQQKLVTQATGDPAQKHGWLAHLVLPEHAGFRQRTTLYLSLILTLSGLGIVLTSVLLHTGLGGVDTALSEGLQGLRTRWSDIPMLAATLSGDGRVMTGVVLSVLAVLVWQLQWHLLAGTTAAFALTGIFIYGLKGSLHIKRPLSDLYSGVDAYSFPSGHAGFSVLLAGILIWFVLKGWRGNKRNMTVTALTLLTGMIALSRIYLGAHWPSDVLASLFFGMAAVLLFTLFFQRESVTATLTTQVLTAAVVSYVLLSGWNIGHNWQSATEKYARLPVPGISLTQDWQQGGWAGLPQYRQDLYGEQEEPFLLQWRGDLAGLQAALPQWVVAPDWSLTTLNGFALGNTTADHLPVLAKLHEGRVETLSLIKPAAQGRYVMRVYPQAITTPDGQADTIWMGTVTYETLYHPLRQLSLLLSSDEQACTADFLHHLPGAVITHETLQGAPEYRGCGGQPVLVSQ